MAETCRGIIAPPLLFRNLNKPGLYISIVIEIYAGQRLSIGHWKFNNFDKPDIAKQRNRQFVATGLSKKLLYGVTGKP
jgi:hypothetical protein